MVLSVPTLPDNGALGPADVGLVPNYQRCGRYITAVVTLLWSSLHRRRSSKAELVADVTYYGFSDNGGLGPADVGLVSRYQRCGRDITVVVTPSPTQSSNT